MPQPLRITQVTAPAQLPVTLGEAKEQLRIDTDDVVDEALLAGILVSATNLCELFTRRALITQTWDLFLDDWPAQRRRDEALWEGWREGAESVLLSSPNFVVLPKPPLQSVTHVKTYDDSDVATTFAATRYFVDAATEPGRLVLRVSQSAPTATRAANAIEIRFVAGYGNNFADVPQPLRDGILRLTAWAYENRGPCDEKTAALLGVVDWWRPYQIMRL